MTRTGHSSPTDPAELLPNKAKILQLAMPVAVLEAIKECLALAGSSEMLFKTNMKEPSFRDIGSATRNSPGYYSPRLPYQEKHVFLPTGCAQTAPTQSTEAGVAQCDISYGEQRARYGYYVVNIYKNRHLKEFHIGPYRINDYPGYRPLGQP
jgi:hypothetical protein